MDGSVFTEFEADGGDTGPRRARPSITTNGLVRARLFGDNDIPECKKFNTVSKLSIRACDRDEIANPVVLKLGASTAALGQPALCSSESRPICEKSTNASKALTQDMPKTASDVPDFAKLLKASAAPRNAISNAADNEPGRTSDRSDGRESR